MKKLFSLLMVVIMATNAFASDRYTWGYWALQRADWGSAVKHFQIGANAGYEDCQLAMAYLHMVGIGTAQNTSKALSMLKKYYYHDDNDDRSYSELWMRFYFGEDMYPHLGNNELFSIPKIYDKLSSGKFTCEYFGIKASDKKSKEKVVDFYMRYLKGHYINFLDKIANQYDASWYRRLWNEFGLEFIIEHARKKNDTKFLQLIEKEHQAISVMEYEKIPRTEEGLRNFLTTCNEKTQKASVKWAIRDYMKIAPKELYINGNFNEKILLVDYLTEFDKKWKVFDENTYEYSLRLKEYKEYKENLAYRSNCRIKFT